MLRSIAGIFPEIEIYEHRIWIVYAGPATDCLPFTSRTASSIVGEINNAVSSGKDIIIFYNISEPIMHDVIKKIHLCIPLLQKIPHMYYATSSLNGNEVYKTLCARYNHPEYLKMLIASEFEAITVNYLLRTNPEDYTPRVRPKKFLCFNRVERPHRINLVGHLINQNLINSSYVSFYSHNYDNTWVTNYKKIAHPLIEKNIEHILIKNKHLFPMHLSGDKVHRNNPIDITASDQNLFSETYYSLVTETLFYKNDDTSNMCYSIFFSEKVFKPIAMKHPFILVSVPHSLKWLRALGYKTFTPFINESYDHEEDDEKRLKLILAEVSRLNNFSEAQWLVWQKKVAEIVNFNYNILMNKTDFRITKDFNPGEADHGF